MNSGFTYQGGLTDDGIPTNGVYDLRFALFNAASGGDQAGPNLTNAAVTLHNGLFTAALDFGAGVFNGDGRWLELQVRTNGAAAFTRLSPRQELTPCAYAHYDDHSEIGPAELQGTSWAPGESERVYRELQREDAR